MNIFRTHAARAAAAETESQYTRDRYDEDEYYDEELDERNEFVDALLLPGDGEKKHMIAMFHEMRKESFFCDVAFLCHGVLFRAHRVVVSSWSRWLRALLCESPDEEVLSLDVFESAAFSAVLDYMYGVPLKITVEAADSIIKVVRRLEMQKLEQQIWRYLMTIIDPHTNCELLHELADRYDCPPLKLAAWRILQETVPGYALSPASKLLRRGQKQRGVPIFDTGLTGPGDRFFNVNLTAAERLQREDDYGETDDDDDETKHYPSVFDEVDGEDEDEDEEDEDQTRDGDTHGESKSVFSKPVNSYTAPEALPANASAKDVIKAWAARLRDVYDSCVPEDAEDYDDAQQDFYISDNNPNVKFVRSTGGGGRGDQHHASGNQGRYQQQQQRHPNNHHQHNSRHQGQSSVRDGASVMSGSQGYTHSQSQSQSQNTQSHQRYPPHLQQQQHQGRGGNDRSLHTMSGPPESGTNYSAASGSPPQSARKGHHPYQQGRGGQQGPQGGTPQRSNSMYTGSNAPPAPTMTSSPSQRGTDNVTSSFDANASNNANKPNKAYLNSSKQLSSGRNIDWREELQRFYTAINLPEKIQTIPLMLETWAGKEEEMVAAMMTKYKKVIPSHMVLHLDQLQMIIAENRGQATEASASVAQQSAGQSGVPSGNRRR